MGAKESKVADQGPFCVAIQDTPQSISKFDVLEAMKEFEPVDAIRVQQNRWIVSLKTINNAARACQVGKIPLPKEECTIFITACDQDEIHGIWKETQVFFPEQKDSIQDSQSGALCVTSPDTGQEFKTGLPSAPTGVSTVPLTTGIPTGQQYPYQANTENTQRGSYNPTKHAPFNPDGMNTRPLTQGNVAGSYRTQVQIFKVLQENIIGKSGATIQRIREETGTLIEFPSENSKSDVIIITGLKNNVEAAKSKIEAIQEELKVSKYTAEIRAKPEYHKLLRKRGGYYIKNVSEKTGVCAMFPNSQATDRDLISIIGDKDAVEKAKAELMKTLENIVEDEVNVDPKHKHVFEGKKNKVLRQIKDEYDLLSVRYENSQVMNGCVILQGERDCVEGAKKKILEIVADMPTGQQHSCIPNLMNMEYDHYKPVMQPPMYPLGMNMRPPETQNPPGQRHSYKPNPMNMEYGGYKSVMQPPMHLLPPGTQNPPGQQHSYKPNPMNMEYGGYKPVMQPPMHLLPPGIQNPPGQQHSYIPNPMNMDYGGYRPVMQPPMYPLEMNIRPPGTQNPPGQRHSYKPNPMNMEYGGYKPVMQPPMHLLPPGTQNHSYEPNPMNMEYGYNTPVMQPPMHPLGMNMRPSTNENVAGSYKTQVQIFKVLQENIIGKNGATIQRIREETGTLIEFPSENSKSDVIIITGLKDNVEAAKSKIEAIQEELKVSKYTAEIRAKPEYHKLLRKRGCYNIKNVSEKTGVCAMFPNSQATDRDLISLIGDKDALEKAKAELIKTLENIVEDEVNVDPKHKHVFEGKKNKVLRQIKDEYDLLSVRYENSQVMNGCVILQGERDCVEGAKKKILEIVSDMPPGQQPSYKPNPMNMEYGRYKPVMQPPTYPLRMKMRPPGTQNVAGSYRTQVQIFKVLQENIIGKNGATIQHIREETGTLIEFPSENSKSDVIIITGLKENVEVAKSKIEAIQEELKVSKYTAEIRAKPEYHKLLRKRGGYNIKNVSEKTGVCGMFPNSQATDRDLISIIGDKDAVEQAKAELIKTLENIVEDEVNVDPKHHHYFEGEKNKVLRKIKDEYDLVSVRYQNSQVMNGCVVLQGERDCVEGAKKKILEIVADMDAHVTTECVIPLQHHRTVIGAKGANVQEISRLHEVKIKFPERPVHGDNNIPNEVNAGRENEVMSPKTSDVITITGKPENCEKAKTALLAFVPVTEEVTVPFKFHGHIIGHKGGNIRKLMEEFNVTLSIPPSEESSDLIKVTGASANVQRAKTALEKKVVSLEKADENRAREQVTVEVIVPFKFRGYIIGQKGANLRKTMEEFSVTISIPPSKESSDLIKVTGEPTNVQRAKAALEQTVSRLEKKNDKRPAKQSQSRAPRRFHKSPGTGQVMTARPRKLKVSNIPKGITADALQMLFENEKRSGGGEVKDLSFDPDSSAAVIEFEDHSVIDRVLQRLPIEIQGMQLNVDVSKENDESEPVIEDENENNGPPKTTVEIRGISKDITTEMLELYFENKKRSGGGPISRIERTDKVALITFESEADTNTVLQRSHRLNEMDLDIKLYTPQEPVLMYRNKLLITGLNEKITVDCLTNFLEGKGGVSLKEILYAEDGEQKALVTFESPPDFKKLQNACQGKKLEGAELEVLQVPVSRCVIATNITPKTSKDMVEMYFENTVCKGEVHVQNVETMDEGAYCIYFDDVLAAESVLEQKHMIDNCHIELHLFHPCIGKTISVEKYRLKQTNGNEKEIHNRIIRNEKKLSKLEACFLSTVNFPEIVRKRYSEVKCTIQQEDDIIVYEGKLKYIKQAEELMHESIQIIKKSALPNNSRSKLQLLTMKETRDYLKQKFEENGCLGVWKIDRDCVTVCDISDQKANEGIHIIKKCLVQNIINMTPEERFIINSDSWTVMLASIDKQHQGYYIIDVHMQDSTVEITSTDQYAGDIVHIVRDFLNANALYKQTITVERLKVRYLEQWQRAQIDDICKSKEESTVKIELNQGVITLEGRQKDLCEAENKIYVLLKQICCKQMSFEKPGMRKYLYSEKGEELVKQIENVNKCTIYLTNQEDDTDKTCVYEHELEHQNHHPQTVECLNCRVPGGRSIFVFHGDITDFDIHILISTCNKTLDQTAGLAKAIVEKGGDVILTECTQHKRQNKLEGDVFFTNGGNLKCKIIAHGVIPVWQEGSDNEEYLKEIVLKSLEEADKRKLTSIGIPAIGTGIFGFPVSLATEVIVRAVQEHFQVQNNSFVKIVYFCDLNANHVTSFIEAVKKFFPANDWTCYQDQIQTTGKTSLPSLGESTGGSIHTTLSDSSGYCSFPRIRVIKGELARQQADVLVNTTSHRLDLTQGAVSASLLAVGGQQLQNECTKKYPDGIKYGDIAITGPGGLRCQSVFHGCLPAWNNDNSALTVLKTFMKNCLSEANRMKMTSIIFPALGTGTLKYPKDVVAREMLSSASEFLAKNPDTSLVTVDFVVYETDIQTFMEFEKEQKEVLKLSSSHKEHDRNAKSEEKREPGSLGLGKNVSSTRTHVLHDDGMKVFIHICAESEIAIQNAIHDVEEKCSKELEIDSITDEGIKRLSDDQISEIEKIGQKHNVKLTLEKRIGRVRIEGIVTDVARGKTEVLSLLREIERTDFKEKQSTMLLQLVQWRFLKSTNESQEWLDYDKNTNAKIEEAYQRKAKVLKLPGGIIIDFDVLEQYSEKDPSVKITVLRKDKIKDLVSEIPQQWDPMDKDNLRLIHLQPTSTEYSGVAQRFMTSIHKGNKHPNVQILKIERIQNKTLYSQYQSKKKLIDEMNPGQINEMDLWHGTAGQAVNSINVHGFNRSFCGKNATVHGEGVYFAKEAYYSAREVYSPPDAAGNKRIYLTKVLTGKYAKGAQGMRVPPPLVSGQPELHDSVVDDVNTPFIFVIFHDTQAYPEYLITFKLN